MGNRREFLKGLGLVTGGAVLMTTDFLRANENEIPNEPEYDIKVVTNIMDSEDAWCTVTMLHPHIPNCLRIAINKDGIAYITLPDSMKFKFVDISVMDMMYNYTTLSQIFITDTPTEIMLMVAKEQNYFSNV